MKTSQKTLDANRKYRERNREAVLYHKRNARLRRFGLEPDDLDFMLDAQDYRCRICGTIIFREGRAADSARIDHCHDCNAVRGLLCLRCNTLLGFIETNEDIHLKAFLDHASHVIRHPKKRIGLDVDGVLANFLQAVIWWAQARGFGMKYPADWTLVTEWNIASHFPEIWPDLQKDLDFWKNIPKHEIRVPFHPFLYMTKRPPSVPTLLTLRWILGNGFPGAPVIMVAEDGEKGLALKGLGVELYVDDKPENVRDCLSVGVPARLFDRPWNRSAMDLDEVRIDSLDGLA